MRTIAVGLLLLSAGIPFGQREATPRDNRPLPQKVEGPPGPYLVLVDPGKDDEFLPAAEAMAALHGAALRRFDPGRLDRTLAELRQAPPRFVVFVLPPEKIDVDLTHAILEMATRVDDDPFVDFEYGFVTGRDGPAACRFVERIAAAWRRDYGKKATLLGSWEGLILPPRRPLAALAALGLSATDRYVKSRDNAEARTRAAQAALADCKQSDLLLFMSHGTPDAMAGCFRAQDLRQWHVDLSPAILFNCACYNGAPGRWFAPGPRGPVDQGVVARDDSVALALLDAGIAGYFAGVDPWHGPLAMQVFYLVVDDGMRLGEAAKRMHDRLALDFLPGRIHFDPTIKNADRFAGEGTVNRRHNGAGMILYGDPAFAPYAKTARHLMTAELKSLAQNRLHMRLELRPLCDQPANLDEILVQSRLMDYYSVKTEDYARELTLEVYRVLPLPAECRAAPSLRVARAQSGDQQVPTGTVETIVEETPPGRLLHVRVPLKVNVVQTSRVLELAKQGITIELETAP